ncbi:uncharacterized protein LOC129988416 [Argiope bruennichi]|uniref:Apoptosis regulatory protein Siva n=1 Tax=Argiope bruennichi TaxID=94029 RepID=A0A8T0EHH3_ARGBR|nr:uncharacterized protein LOC129988416 [Argiope bruennichi]KAF8772053.1 hypothetical protein HNY73_019399 [Argiope bruennichi]
MPKRKNVFDELPILSKMHIGIKEINLLSVNCAENMKKVYERTHSLLFSGSANPCAGANRMTSQNLNNSVFKKSVLLGKKETNNNTGSCCLSRSSAVCAFCDKPMCSSCCRICSLCKMEYCHLCSVLQYDTHDETAVCLSCL